MGRIKVMPADLVSLISAGEVIENPASIVKELVENSLDAGATQIEISIENGGIDRVAVSDNGIGMLREDCLLSLHRYATSKIACKEDIEHITTYGFRGEALASIAAVANVTIDTHSIGEERGCRLVSRIGEQPALSDSARKTGTTVEVTHLFSRVPARKKHMSSPKTEGLRAVDIITRHAAVRHDVGFRFVKDGETTIDCPALQDQLDRLLSLWGTAIRKNLMPVSYSSKGTSVSGFVVRPPVSRGNRSREYFSVLKRPIEDSRLSAAVEAAYATLLMRGRYPVCCLDIVTDVTNVDANVHPTKREVRIADIDLIVKCVTTSAKRALSAHVPPETSADLSDYAASATHSEPVLVAPNARTIATPQPLRTIEVRALEGTSDVPDKTEMDVPPLGGQLRIVGQIHGLYILLESDEGLLIVDQHAAHERVVYERLRRQVNDGRVIAQELLEPMVLKLAATDAERILALAPQLESFGYSISAFGGGSVLVSSYPEVLGRNASAEELVSLIDEILDIGAASVEERFMDEVVKVTACHSAIRAGQVLDTNEVHRLLEEMAETPNRYNCPHGRPTLIRLTKRELDSKFRRT